MVQPVSSNRYSLGGSLPELGPPVAVLDNQRQEAIALCWSREKAQLIVDLLNAQERPTDLEQMEKYAAWAKDR